MGSLKFSCVLCKSKPGPRFNTERHIWTRHVRQTMGPQFTGSYYEPAEHKKLVIQYMAVLEGPRTDVIKQRLLSDEYNWHHSPSTAGRYKQGKDATLWKRHGSFEVTSAGCSAERPRVFSQGQRAASEPYPLQRVESNLGSITSNRGYDFSAVLGPAALSSPSLPLPIIRPTPLTAPQPDTFQASLKYQPQHSARRLTSSALPREQPCVYEKECVCGRRTTPSGPRENDGLPATAPPLQAVVTSQVSRSTSDPQVINCGPVGGLGAPVGKSWLSSPQSLDVFGTDFGAVYGDGQGSLQCHAYCAQSQFV